MKAIKSGIVRLGNLEIKCHVLENGQRVIEEQSVIDFFEFLESGTLLTQREAEDFAANTNDPSKWEPI